MSYDISLNDPVTKLPIEIKDTHFMIGGNYRIGGSTELSLNITYNYAPLYYPLFGKDGIRTIYGKTGLESIPILENVISQLGDEIDDDYWKATEGNAKRALIHLLTMAKMRPDGIWDGD
jgi:hypothetical protein